MQYKELAAASLLLLLACCVPSQNQYQATAGKVSKETKRDGCTWIIESKGPTVFRDNALTLGREIEIFSKDYSRTDLSAFDLSKPAVSREQDLYVVSWPQKNITPEMASQTKSILLSIQQLLDGTDDSGQDPAIPSSGIKFSPPNWQSDDMDLVQALQEGTVSAALTQVQMIDVGPGGVPKNQASPAGSHPLGERFAQIAANLRQDQSIPTIDTALAYLGTEADDTQVLLGFISINYDFSVSARSEDEVKEIIQGFARMQAAECPIAPVSTMPVSDEG